MDSSSPSSPSLGSLWPKGKTTLAVLPFLDMSPQKNLDYFCEGISEELINGLSLVEELAVVSRTSAFQFKERSQDLREIGEKLKATLLLEAETPYDQLVQTMDAVRVYEEKVNQIAIKRALGYTVSCSLVEIEA